MPTISLYFFVVLLVLFTQDTEAQVDSSAGTYSCYPCGRAKCGFKDGGSSSLLIEPPPDGSTRNFQALTCKEFQHEADLRRVDPEMCSYFSQVTRSSSNPCECMERRIPFRTETANDICIDPNQPQACNLCGHGKIIGDPEKVLPAPYKATCANFYDLQQENLATNQGGFSDGFCNDLKALFLENDRCKCREPAAVAQVTQCLLQLDFGSECNPNLEPPDDVDQCCIGTCQWLNRYQKHLCTTQPGDPRPDNQTAPSTTPTTSPSTAPSLLSEFSSVSLSPLKTPSIPKSQSKSLSPSFSPSPFPSLSTSSSPSLAPMITPLSNPSNSSNIEIIDQAPQLSSESSNEAVELGGFRLSEFPSVSSSPLKTPSIPKSHSKSLSPSFSPSPFPSLSISSSPILAPIIIPSSNSSNSPTIEVADQDSQYTTEGSIEVVETTGVQLSEFPSISLSTLNTPSVSKSPTESLLPSLLVSSPSLSPSLAPMIIPSSKPSNSPAIYVVDQNQQSPSKSSNVILESGGLKW
eukprot:CAMPEP_0194132586 /NCGR_PEP_ID=MMETSP0152-20130528/3017_1 /TAXON_ID=1049557 /ORGANISM="Thalassiothrix antarctica, Strain L6-D1" /LENGTH=520 /DNA_ID=CAMNT_0038827685 /DNA_START=23 /DNA_END=1582 /DNA_ORIENTATION=+